MKHLWNQIQAQLEINNKIHCKSKNLFFLDYYRTSTQLIWWTETTILWKFFVRTISERKWKINAATSTKNWRRKSNVTEKKNWNVINCYDNRINLILKPDKTILLWQLLKWYLQHQKKVPPQQVTWSDFSILLPFLLHVMTEGKERAFVTDYINSTETVIIWTKSLPSEKHCTDFYWISLIREHHCSCFC